MGHEDPTHRLLESAAARTESFLAHRLYWADDRPPSSLTDYACMLRRHLHVIDLVHHFTSALPPEEWCALNTISLPALLSMAKNKLVHEHKRMESPAYMA